jgi:hypothetical protein
MTKRKKLPLGIQTFSEIIEGGYYYVDKTALAWQLIENGKYYFLSRPRRFGKSLFLDTLKEIFSARQDLFRGLAIDAHYDWQVSHPVLRLNLARRNHVSVQQCVEMVNHQLQAYEQEFGLPAGASAPALRLADLIARLHLQTGKKVVVLVDEYDKPILDHIDQPESARQMRDFLRDLYSALKTEDEHLRFVLLTGVSKFSKVSLFSGLNHLTDITLDTRYATLCGYTETELHSTFADRLKEFSRDEIRRWYNGYCWLGESVYNPWSILNLLDKRQFRAYWAESGQPAFLLKLLASRQIFTPRLAAWQTDESLLGRFDVDDIEPEALLFQTGYLTIKAINRQSATTQYTLCYPNREVETSLNAGLLATLIGGAALLQFDQPLREAILRADWAALEQQLTAQFAAIPYNYHTQNAIARYEGYYASIFFCMLATLGFAVQPEDVTNRGRIDLTLTLPDKICLFEFKVVASDASQEANQAAIRQMRKQQYAQKFAASAVPVFLIGITFSQAARNISAFQWEAASPDWAMPASESSHEQTGHAQTSNVQAVNASPVGNLQSITAMQAIATLPDSQAELKTLLTRLVTLIEHSPLPDTDKKDAMQQTGIIVEAAQQPAATQAGRVRRALDYIKGIFSAPTDAVASTEPLQDLANQIGHWFGQ